MILWLQYKFFVDAYRVLPLFTSDKESILTLLLFWFCVCYVSLDIWHLEKNWFFLNLKKRHLRVYWVTRDYLPTYYAI